MHEGRVPDVAEPVDVRESFAGREDGQLGSAAEQVRNRLEVQSPADEVGNAELSAPCHRVFGDRDRVRVVALVERKSDQVSRSDGGVVVVSGCVEMDGRFLERTAGLRVLAGIAQTRAKIEKRRTDLCIVFEFAEDRKGLLLECPGFAIVTEFAPSDSGAPSRTLARAAVRCPSLAVRACSYQP